MEEIDEIAQHMKRMKKENEEQRTAMSQLKSQNRILDDRSRYLLRKLQEASALYDEAGRKVVEFTSKQTTPITEDIKNLKQKIKAADMISGRMEALQKSVALLEQKIEENARRVENREKELGAVSAGLDSLSKAVAGMQKLPEKFSTTQLKVEDGLEFFRKGMADFNSEFAALGGRIKPLESSLKAVQLYIPKMEKLSAGSLAALDNRIEKQRADISAIQNAIRAEIDKAADRLKAKAEEYGEKKSEEFRKLQKDMLAARAEVDEKIRFLDSQFTKFSEIKERLRQEINKDNENFLRQLASGLESLRAGQTGMIKALESLGGREELLDNKIEQMKKLEAMIEEVREALSASKDGIDAKVAKLIEKVSGDLSGFRNSCSAGIQALKEQAARHEAMMENMGKNILEIEQELPALQSEISKQHAAMEKAGGRVSEAMEKAAERLKAHSEKQNEKTKAEFAECIRQFMEVREQVEQRLEFLGSQSSKFSEIKERLKEEINKSNDRTLSMMGSAIKNLEAGQNRLITSVEKLSAEKERLLEKTAELMEAGRQMSAGFSQLDKSVDVRISEAVSPLATAVSSHEKALSKINEAFSEKISAASEKLKFQTEQQYVKSRESVEKMTAQLLKVKAEADEQLKFMASQFSKFSDIKEKLKMEINRSNDKAFSAISSELVRVGTESSSLRSGLENLKATADRMAEQIKGMEESEIRALQSSVAKHEKTLSRIDGLFDDKLARALEKLRMQAEQNAGKNSAGMEKMFREFIAVKSEVDERLQFLTSQFSKFTEIKERLKEEINAQNQKAVAGLEKSVTQLKSSQSDTAAACEFIKNRGDALAEKVGNLVFSVESLPVLRKRADGLEKQVASELALAKKEMSGMSGFMAQVEGRLEEIERGSLKSVEQRMSAMKDSLMKDFSRMKEDLTKQATLIPSLEEKLEELESRKSGTGEIKHLKDMLQSMIEVSRRDVQEMSKRLDRLESLKISSISSGMDEMRKEMNAGQARIMRDFTELKAHAEEKSDMLSEQFARLDEMKERLKQEIRKENAGKISELSAQIKALSRHLHDVQNELGHAVKDYSETIDKLTEEVER